jgi:NAD(P)-dependent dehydrogenase (short-subunit alcohol dehydrogenase family)
MTVHDDFAGTVALVTGAGSGMGLATARAFAESGAGTVLADRNAGLVRPEEIAAAVLWVRSPA